MAASYKKSTYISGKKIFLYVIDPSEKEIWQYRFKSPISGKYIRRTTGETDEHEAARIALEAYEDLKVKHRIGSPEINSTFTNIFNEFIGAPTKSVKHHMRMCFDSYWSKYFGETDLYSVKDDDIQKYFVWRTRYWENHDGKHLIGGRPRKDNKTRSTTLMKERSYLKYFFRRAFERKMIALMPAFPKDFHGFDNVVTLTQKTRRGRFSRGKSGDYEKVRAAFSKISKNLNKEVENHPVWQYRHRQKRYDYANVWAYLLLIANTGLRPQEATRLQWRDIETKPFGLWTDEDGTEYTYINIREEVSKVKNQRDVLSRDFRDTYDRMMMWKKEWVRYWQREPEPNDLIFPHTARTKTLTPERKPRQMVNLVKGFHKRVGVYEQTVDGERTPRTAYSYRAHFISERIANFLNIYNIARLCGTSVEMITKHYDINLNLQHRAEITKHLKWEKTAGKTGVL